MLEMLFCSMLTILPDYLFRRYVQGRRLGHEITFYSVWFELRWGITSCVVLTVCLITVIFYNHPSTTNVTMLLAGVLVLAAAIIIITSGESVAVRFLTAVVSLDVATRLVIYGGRRT